MRFLFLCVCLINIVFFIWEYRKGAPEVYWPSSYENNPGSAKYIQKIVLLSESNRAEERKILTQQSLLPSDIDIGNEPLLRETELQDIVHYTTLKMSDDKEISEDKLIKPRDKLRVLSQQEDSQPATDGQLVTAKHNAMPGLNSTLFTCYQLKKGSYTKNTLIEEMDGQAYSLALFEQQQRDAGSYLVLTLADNSLEEAVNSEQEMKQQGMTDLWLFREGVFQWRISLGLFAGIELAEKAKELFLGKTRRILEVVPSYLKTSISRVKISTHDEQGRAAFEKKFADIVDQQVDCDDGGI